MFQEKMYTEATPERVFAFCRAVIDAKEQSNESSLKSLLEPTQNTAYFGRVRDAARELGLVQINDKLVSLSVDGTVLKTISSMRRYINAHIEKVSGGLFWEVTRCFYEKSGEWILFGAEQQKTENLTRFFSQELGKQIRNEDFLAWRFWIPFLGLGNEFSSAGSKRVMVLPNAAGYLGDLLAVSGMKKGDRYTLQEFMDRMGSGLDLVRDPDQDGMELNYGFSNGLRLLRDQKKLRLEHQLDSLDTWRLYPFAADANDLITHVEILKV